MSTHYKYSAAVTAWGQYPTYAGQFGRWGQLSDIGLAKVPGLGFGALGD